MKACEYTHLCFFLSRSRAVCLLIPSLMFYTASLSKSSITARSHPRGAVDCRTSRDCSCSCSCARSTADPAWYDEWWCCVYSAVFTSAWNCSRGPNAQSNGIHPKESPTVYSDLADRIDTPLYGTTEHYQMTEDVSSNQQRTSARMTGCDDWRAAASATGFGDNER